MFCNKCGFEVENGASFCPMCGAQFHLNEKVDRKKQGKPKHRGMKVIGIVCAFVLILAVIAGVELQMITNDFKHNSYTIGSLKYRYDEETDSAVVASSGESITEPVIVIPSTIKVGLKSYPVTALGAYSFSDCDDLTSITIPDSVISIGFKAFENCDNLTSITIPDSVISIGYNAFANSDNLTSITIPDSVTSIEGATFFSCDNLTSIIIPDSVTSIGASAFLGCKSLTSITIPENVTYIGNDAFSQCTSLISITIPDNVTSIENGTFGLCDNLTSVTLPEHLTDIGRLAFLGCDNLTSITLPETVTDIGESAFMGCTNLTITVPASVRVIGELAFHDVNKVIYQGKESWHSLNSPDDFVDENAYREYSDFGDTSGLK